MGSRINSKYFLTDFVIYCHVVIFLIPWQPVPYKPSWLGPIDLWIVLFLILVWAFLFEVFYFGKLARCRWQLGGAIVWFVLINVFGVLSSVLEINPVRQYIPLSIQFARAIPYADGLLIYYLIQRNQWGKKQFETFFFVVLAAGFVISLECLLVFYLKLPLGISRYSLWQDEGAMWFISLFCQGTTHPGPIGIITAVISLYFWTSRKQPFYLIICLMAVALVLANVTLLAYIGLFSGMAYIIVFFLYSSKVFKNKIIVSAITLFLAVSISYVGLHYGKKWRPTITKAELLKEKSQRRAYQIVRSLDVLMNYPALGGGGGIGYYYAYSKYTSPIVTKAVSGFVPEKNLGLNWYLEDPFNGRTYSIHSVFANFWADLGLFGLFFLIYFYFRWMKWGIRLFFKKQNNRSVKYSLLLSVLLGMILALTVFISGKPKFYPFWFFAVLIGCVEYYIRKLKECDLVQESPA